MESNYFFEKKKKQNKTKQNKKHCLKNSYFWYTLLCDFGQNLLVFVPKGNNFTKIDHFRSKR